MRKRSSTMKRVLFLGVGSAMMFTMGGVGPAQADNGPHVSTAFTTTGLQTVATDRCASCHRAHTSKGAYNLVQAQPGLCYTCHGAGATGGLTDVIDGAGKGTAPGALRAGGFSSARINTAAPQKTWVTNSVTGLPQVDPAQTTIPALADTQAQATTSSHNINNVAGIAYGGGPVSAAQSMGTTMTLECGSCHDPHGNGNYRILRPIPVDSTGKVPFELNPYTVSSTTGLVTAAATVSTAAGIKIPDAPGTDPASRALTHKYVTTNYWLAGDSNVAQDTSATAPVPLLGTAKAANTTTGGLADVAGDGYIQNIAAWCTTCHTRYLAGSGSHSKALDNSVGVVGVAPTAATVTDSTFMYRHRSNVNYKTGGANCITCHVAHGTNAKATGNSSTAGVAPYTLLDGGNPVLGTQDSRLLRVDNRGICIMCHNV
jgi:predicted CXXCH cytochrome family protein